jgi:Tol biopolymer transport system component
VTKDRRIAYSRRTREGPRLCYGRIGASAEIREERCPALGVEPAWSPDGGRLAFVGATGWSPDPSKLTRDPDVVWILNLETGAFTRVANNAREPAWSPKGRYLAVSSLLRGGLGLVDLKHPRWLRNLTSSPRDRGPAWNPVTDEITFVRHDPATSRSYLASVNPRTTQIRGVTSGFEDTDPAWSRDGRYLAFSRAPMGIHIKSLWLTEIFVLDRKTSVIERLTRDRVYDSNPAWLP